jgi:hypothetical protein
MLPIGLPAIRSKIALVRSSISLANDAIGIGKRTSMLTGEGVGKVEVPPYRVAVEMMLSPASAIVTNSRRDGRHAGCHGRANAAFHGRHAG